MTAPRWTLVLKSARVQKNGNSKQYKLAILPLTTVQQVWDATVSVFCPNSNFDRLELAAATDVDIAVTLGDMLASLKTHDPDVYMMPDRNKQEAYLTVRGGLGRSLPAPSSSLQGSQGLQKAVKTGRKQAPGSKETIPAFQLALDASKVMRKVSCLLLPRSSSKDKYYNYLPLKEQPPWAKATVLKLTAAQEKKAAGYVDEAQVLGVFTK